MRDSIVGNLERINNVLQFQEESIKTRLEEENKKLTRDVDSLQVRTFERVGKMEITRKLRLMTMTIDEYAEVDDNHD